MTPVTLPPEIETQRQKQTWIHRILAEFRSYRRKTGGVWYRVVIDDGAPVVWHWTNEMPSDPADILETETYHA